MNTSPDLILTADIHLRETNPVCRLDDFIGQTQWDNLDYLYQLQKKYNCPIINAGDLFHRAKNSNWLITKTINHLPNDFWTIFGDHDFPYKTEKNVEQSSIETLRTAGKINVINNSLLGEFELNDKKILINHRFVWDGKKWPWPECNEITADGMIDKYPDYDLIVTGDYHKGFTHKKNNTLLVNCGCFSRQDASYIDYTPRVYLWYSQSNAVEPVYLPINTEAVSRQHIEKKQNHDQRLTAFVGWISQDWEKTWGKTLSGIKSTQEILKEFFSQGKVKKDIKEIIYKSME